MRGCQNVILTVDTSSLARLINSHEKRELETNVAGWKFLAFNRSSEWYGIRAFGYKLTSPFARFSPPLRIIFTVAGTRLTGKSWTKARARTDRYQKMICTRRRMTRESCIRAEFTCKQRGTRRDRCRRRRKKRGKWSRRVCVLTTLARNYFQSGTSVTTGKIGFYAFIARIVCAGKISLKFAQDFSSECSSPPPIRLGKQAERKST